MNQDGVSVALERLRRGDAEGAYEILRQAPQIPDAQRLLGVACRRLGRGDEAETALKAAVRTGKRDPANHAEYAAFLFSAGRNREAEKAFRAALALDRRHAYAATGLANLLIAEGRTPEALQVTTPLMSASQPAVGLRHMHASALRELNRFAEAETLMKQVVDERPLDDRVQAELAELVWMRTADAAAATASIDRALASQPDAIGLQIARAKVLNQAGDPDAARAGLDAALARAPDNPTLLAARGRLGGEGQVDLLERAAAAQPENLSLKTMLAQASLEAGETDRASDLVGQVLLVQPLDQFALALQATAWRLQGDARYGEIYDYERTVHINQIGTPKGWPDLKSYLADLAKALHALHTVKTHPFGQSVKGGSQITLIGQRDPAIAAFEKAIEPPIRATIEALKAGGHPLGARATGKWRYTGMWSIKLRTSGYHDNHIHNEGWLSSACYIELPPLPGHEGWFKLGQPGLKLPTPLEPDRFVEPQEGRLVLFPSYMWHGVEPFTSDAPRLTIAFDLVPVPD